MADYIGATPMQSPIMGLLAERLKQAQQFAAKPFGYQNPPAEMLMNLLGIPAIQQTAERYAYGEPMTTGRGMTTQVRPEVLEAAMTVAPVAGLLGRGVERGAMAAGRAGERLAERVVPQVMERGGLSAQLMQDLGQGSMSRVVPEAGLLTPMRESLVPGVEAGKEMIVHHNISPQKLANVEKVGGMPVPSIAVSNVDNPMLGFGDISLIGSKEMAIPSAKNPVYGFDAYTARAPKIDYQIDPKSRKALENSLSDIASEIPDGAYSVDRLIGNWEDRKYSDVLKAKFLKDEGYGLPKVEDFKDEPWKYSSSLSESVGNLKGEYADWLTKYEKSLPDVGVNIKERIFKGFTDSGNRRYADATLENFVKEMKGGAGSEGFMYGVGNIRAVATPKFKTLNQVKAARENIVTPEKFEPIKKQIGEAFDNISDRLNKLEGRDGYSYDAPDALYEIGQLRNVNLLDKIYKDVPESLKADIQIFMNKVKEMPTEYFEIKPQRAVQVGEFKGAILPADAPKQSIDYLRSQGLQDLYYYSTPEERKSLFKKFGPEMFGTLPLGLLGDEEIRNQLNLLE